MTNTFYIDKTTGTFSDELLAAGFERLLRNLLFQQGVPDPDIVQSDAGHRYEISVSPALDMERVLADTAHFVVAPLLRTVKNRAQLPVVPEDRLYLVDYEIEKERVGAFYDAYQKLEGTLKRAWAVGDDAGFDFDSMPAPPHERWEIFTLLNAPPMPINGYNQVLTQWLAAGEAGQTGAICHLICDLFSHSPNDVEAAVSRWKTVAKPHKWGDQVTASQFLNPSQGKGVNKAQPDGVGLGNLNSFWLLELLKTIGFYHTASTGRVKNSDDRKSYVPAAGRSTLSARDRVQQRFRGKMRFADTAVRSDIFTIIRYLQAFIEESEQAGSQPDSAKAQQLFSLLGQSRKPADFLRGFHAVYYKSLGTAAATMNIAFLNLPGWVELRSREDVTAFQEILEEHLRIVQQFAENKGEEIALLQAYRDFLVADNLDPFFEFTTAYSSWLISAGEKSGFPPRPFSTQNLRRLLVSVQPELSAILESAGFRNIAYAIRQSTVTAQYRKGQNDRRYDVRYGLGRDLVRHSQYPDEFIAALSDFLHKYNAENAQVMETRSGPYRRSVQTSDIDDILRLIDQYGSDLIAKLLVAYGYAREPRQESPTETTA